MKFNINLYELDLKNLKMDYNKIKVYHISFANRAKNYSIIYFNVHLFENF